MSQSLFQQIYSIVCQIPPGQAATYGQIALLLGNPRMSRVVGTALSVCRDDAVPCHRVVNRSGGLCDAFFSLRQGNAPAASGAGGGAFYARRHGRFDKMPLVRAQLTGFAPFPANSVCYAGLF